MRSARVLPTAALLLILAIAAGLRLTGLDREGFWGDEYAQTQLYDLSLHHTCYYAATRHAFGPPDFIIGWLAYRISPTVWMCRLPSAIWGVVAVGACFALARRLFSWRQGAIAAALLALCPLHLMISQEARPYSICLAFMLMTLVLLLRAYERPTRLRVALFGVVAFTTVMTRSFTPAVMLLVVGVVVTIALIKTRRRGPRDVSLIPPYQGRKQEGLEADGNAAYAAGAPGEAGFNLTALKRIWIATIAAGLIAMPAVAFMYITCYAGDGVTSKLGLNNYGIDPRYLPKVARYLTSAGTVLLENFGPIVVALACVGVVMTLTRWRTLSPERRAVFAVMLLMGPAVIAIYAAIGGTHLYYSRYSFYLMPICAIFAASAVVAIVEALQRTTFLGRALPAFLPARGEGGAALVACPLTKGKREAAPPASPLTKGGKRGVDCGTGTDGAQHARPLAATFAGKVVIAMVIAATLVQPAGLAAGYKETRHRRDWRGCAAHLRETITPEDVVMVLTDAPFGRVQHRFFGKYEWPRGRRPLGEAMWTLASSDAHFERLMRQTGRCYTVIAYDVADERPDGYLSRGLADAPPGYRLIKFRGIDLLIRDERAAPPGSNAPSNLQSEIVAICDRLLATPHADPSANVIPLTLKSRILDRLGKRDRAVEAYRRALHMVPPIHRDYYDHATAWIAADEHTP